MKKYTHLLLLFCFFALQSMHANAQMNSVAAGGVANGIGGSVSFSIGQIDYVSALGSGGYINQGLQQPYKSTMNVKFFVQGYYAGNGLMEAVLQNEGQPNGLNDADTVLVELHATLPPYSLAHSYKGVLKTNGSIQCDFPNASEGQPYYMVLKQRNAIETWSTNPITLSNGVYDFTTSAGQAFGSNQVLIDVNTYGLFSGDINQDENIDLLDASILELDVSNFEFGYLATDINGDGNVDLLDNPIVENNISGFIYSSHP